MVISNPSYPESLKLPNCPDVDIESTPSPDKVMFDRIRILAVVTILNLSINGIDYNNEYQSGNRN